MRRLLHALRARLDPAQRRLRRRARRRARSERIARILMERHGSAVLSGPFRGLIYPSALTPGSALLPKLVGSYEAEVHPILQRIVDRAYRQVINVGCGEGYYAVGLARRLPQASVFAFDANEAARDACTSMAAANGVADRVQVGGACDAACLAGLAQDGALVVCDCEGCEYELLDPDRIPALQACDLLVELHDLPGETRAWERILARFADTHTATVVTYGRRDASEYSALQVLPRRDRRFAVDEDRSRGLRWAYLERRA